MPKDLHQLGPQQHSAPVFRCWRLLQSSANDSAARYDITASSLAKTVAALSPACSK